MYTGSKILVLSSSIFGMIGLFTIPNNYQGYFMIMTSLLSINYHRSGNELARKIDIFGNSLVGLSLSYINFRLNNYFPGLCAFISYSFYKKIKKKWTPLKHLLLVHLVAICGFINIYRTKIDYSVTKNYKK